MSLHRSEAIWPLPGRGNGAGKASNRNWVVRQPGLHECRNGVPSRFSINHDQEGRVYGQVWAEPDVEQAADWWSDDSVAPMGSRAGPEGKSALQLQSTRNGDATQIMQGGEAEIDYI